MPLGDSGAAQVGDPVVAIGNPFGFTRTVTTGIVSAVAREIKAPNGFSISNVIQTDASINPGNSGGPLMDADGRVIGINSQIATGGGSGSVGIGFAIPINTAKRLLPQLREGGKIERAYLGIVMSPVSADLARDLNLPTERGRADHLRGQGRPGREGGPARRAHRHLDRHRGRRRPDRGGGRAEGETPEDVSAAIADDKPGDTVAVTYYRGNDRRTARVKLGQRPANSDAGGCGSLGHHALADRAYHWRGDARQDLWDHLVADARASAELGAWAVGLIFWPGSPRLCAVEDAELIGAELHRHAEVAGVFVNATLDEVASTADRCGLTLLQLHGDEGPAYCREAARRTGCRVIKAARVRDAAQVRALRPFHTDFHLLDAHSLSSPGRHRRELRLGPDQAARRRPSARALRRAHPGERGGGDRVHAAVRGGHRQRHRGGAGAQGPGQAGRVLQSGGERRRARGRRGVSTQPLERRFGPYGGRYVPETLVPALDELEREWLAARADPAFQEELGRLLRDFAGRPTPLYRARASRRPRAARCSSSARTCSTPASHKLNNALGQGLLARRMGKPRVIAETGAGQHGVASATACALLGLECVVYMGAEDMRRQRPNVQRMHLLGARGASVEAGARDAQGGGVGRDPRLGRERGDHPLRDRLRGGPGALSGARARPPARDRRRGARPDPRGHRAACPTA